MALYEGQANKLNKGESRTVLIAAGGTSGHIFPALAIAKELRAICPPCRIVFSGVIDGLEHKMALQFRVQSVTAQNLPSGMIGVVDLADTEYTRYATQLQGDENAETRHCARDGRLRLRSCACHREDVAYSLRFT